MALRTVITERQRRIGLELRRLREQAELNVSEASSLIGMGATHLSHIEAARTAIPEDRLRALAEGYQVKDEPYIDALVEMSESSGKGWWSAYRKFFPQFTLDLAELESRATAIHSYETLVIPGLLQTESYMRTLFRKGRPGASREEIERLVRFRRERQEILSACPTVTFHAVIHEAALRVAVGGAQVMKEQVVHLARASTRPGVTIQFLPFEAGVSSGWFSAPFTLLSPGVPGLETVVAEHPSANLRLSGAETIAQYQATLARLSENSLPPMQGAESPEMHERRDSLGLVRHVLYTY